MADLVKALRKADADMAALMGEAVPARRSRPRKRDGNGQAIQPAHSPDPT